MLPRRREFLETVVGLTAAASTAQGLLAADERSDGGMIYRKFGSTAERVSRSRMLAAKPARAGTPEDCLFPLTA